MKKPILSALRKEKDSIPFWMMRQAGRYLPEYRKLKEKAGSFLNLCYNPEYAAEATLQPIKRFGPDAAIIFSDILVIPHSLGLHLEYHEGKGPVLERITARKKINSLKKGNVRNHLQPVADALSFTKRELPQSTALIGFAGAPWTVATYMIEGGSSKDFSRVKKFSEEHSRDFLTLLDILTEETIDYLLLQIEAGADAVQIFDSWAGILAEENFNSFVIRPTKKIVAAIKNKFPHIPVIGFPKSANNFLERFIAETGVDGISIDSKVPLKYAKNQLQEIAAVQGNLDPEILLGGRQEIKKETRKIIEALKDGPFIFNLGHGILPATPIANVEIMIEEIRK